MFICRQHACHVTSHRNNFLRINVIVSAIVCQNSHSISFLTLTYPSSFTLVPLFPLYPSPLFSFSFSFSPLFPSPLLAFFPFPLPLSPISLSPSSLSTLPFPPYTLTMHTPHTCIQAKRNWMTSVRGAFGTIRSTVTHPTPEELMNVFSLSNMSAR